MHRFSPPTPLAAATADNTDHEEEQTMTMHEYLMKAIQDDARRAGERDRLLTEARRARRARRQNLVPAAPARHRTEGEGIRLGGWVGLTGNSPQRAKLTLDVALAAGAWGWLCARLSGSSRSKH